MSQESEITGDTTITSLSVDSETKVVDVESSLPGDYESSDVESSHAEERYLPAYELIDGSLERAGRGLRPVGINWSKHLSIQYKTHEEFVYH